ncbi:BTB/POZ domain-containing protein 1 [Orchesella cincta]|uniref:BTB/POZ domain-containing protein 1 n=1 Tax=Orchesella cincta TaxID=48709 RepID=A0A1D2N7W5_ORCCI|nr:BTB/POZ domain-containing protein 1 [Orchesella cincta]
MNYHNSNSYVSCVSDFDSISEPLAKKVVAADVYVIESDKHEEALEQTVTRICDISEESWDYSGVFYTNCFRSNKPILLTSLGFFGPAVPQGFQGPVAYVVDVQIGELIVMPRNHKTSWRFTVSVAGTESIFYVSLPSPLRIIPNVWYAIKFQLEGPDTLRGSSQLDRIKSSDGIIFDFFQGSLQMPSLKYIRRYG